MSEQQGPLEELDVFNPVNFRGSGGGDQFVTYNTAQGLVIFPNGIQFGDGTVLTTADVSGQNITGVVNPMNTDLDANLFAINNVTDLQTSSISLNTQSGLLTELSVNAPIKYADSTVQNSAFTGAGSLAGTYTSADVTIDSNGKITAISNGTASAPNIVYSAWASTLNFTSGSNQGTLVSVALTPGTWQLIGVVCVNIGGGASFNPFGNVSNPYALCSINPSGSGTIAIGTIASPNNGATWSGNSQQFYTYVQTVVTITSNTTYNLQYNVRVDLTQGFMSVPNINPPTYLRAIQLG